VARRSRRSLRSLGLGPSLGKDVKYFNQTHNLI